MKVLVIADEESSALWDFYNPEKLKGVELILSCGDLNRHYLEFLVTMAHCPLLYIRGNHDGAYMDNPPEGCICIEDKVYDYKGLRILGLGGSMRYHPDNPNMYTEQEMKTRISRVNSQIWIRNGFDILLAHAPAKGYGDMEDLPHQGFDCFNTLLERYKPAYMFHGHVHQSYAGSGFVSEYAHTSGTKIINSFGYKIIEIGQEAYPEIGKTGSFIYDLVMSMKESRGSKY
ncbi:MAG: metallophosphoesterase [Eubacteriales bacterium]|nr:metallophosphoesterase [Eubacteriales bacterium]